MVRVVGHEGAQKLGNGSDGELGPPAMVDARSGVEWSEVERGGARGSERGVELWPGQRVAATRLRQGIHDAWSRGSSRMLATHRPRGISTNRWQAPEWARWTSKLGLLRADLVHGPKTKFALHGLLYVSYLRCLII